MLVIAWVVATGVAFAFAGYGITLRLSPSLASPHLSRSFLRRIAGRAPGVVRLVRRDDEAAEATAVAITVAGLIVLIGLLAVGTLLVMVDTDTGFARFDQGLAEFGASHATAASTSVLRRLNELGGTVAVILAALAVAAYELRRTRRLAVVGFLVLVVGGQFAVLNLVKVLVDRPRPAIDQLSGFSSTSFPSGHATAAAATYMACALLLSLGRSRRARSVLFGLAAGIAAAVASIRVLLGVHWLTDVLAGMALGWVWFAVCSIAFGGTVLRFGAPAVQIELNMEEGDSRPTPDATRP